MNEPSVIQSQQAKWMEVILLWLGILIPIQTGPVIYQYLKWSDSKPDLVCNGLGAVLILIMSVSVLMKYQSLSLRILKGSPSYLEISNRDSVLSGWLTIGIFTFGFVYLILTISTMSYVFGDQLSLWVSPLRKETEMTEWKMWFFMSIYALTYIPQITGGLLFTFFSQRLAILAISIQKRHGFRKTETPIS